MSTQLPTPQQGFDNLSAHGRYMSKDLRTPERLGSITYRHPENGERPVAVDTATIAECEALYTNERVHPGLARLGCNTYKIGSSLKILRTMHRAHGLVWGFSGFATPGYTYKLEAQAMLALLIYLDMVGERPSLITDGGVSDGVLGLSGALAQLRGIPSMGFIPLQGLTSMGPRAHLVIAGDLYTDRDKYVGTAPDVLVCVGGHKGALRECLAALDGGGIVIVMEPRDYGPDSLPQWCKHSPRLMSAMANGQLMLCKGTENIGDTAGRAITAARRDLRPSRTTRMRALGQLLGT